MLCHHFWVASREKLTCRHNQLLWFEVEDRAWEGGCHRLDSGWISQPRYYLYIENTRRPGPAGKENMQELGLWLKCISQIGAFSDDPLLNITVGHKHPSSIPISLFASSTYAQCFCVFSPLHCLDPFPILWASLISEPFPIPLPVPRAPWLNAKCQYWHLVK